MSRPRLPKPTTLKDICLRYTVSAIVGWDDFLLADHAGRYWRVPTVPLAQKYLEQHRQVHELNQFESDDRYAGKIKWYIHPIVFGGDPASEENMAWINIKKHQEFVIWWNEKYRNSIGE